MSTRAGANGLIQAMKELNMKWEQTKDFWRDQKCRQFEVDYLSGLAQHVARASAAIEEVDAVLSKVRSDCE